MLERQLSKDFVDIFKEYPILTPSNRSAGWPDRGIQVNNSRIIWFELKVVPEKYGSTTITISELTNHQAAFLAKWQMNGGFGYLFLGLVGYKNTLERYAILRCSNWITWLKVPGRKVDIKQLLLFEDKQSVLKWFKEMFTPQATRATPNKAMDTAPGVNALIE